MKLNIQILLVALFYNLGNAANGPYGYDDLVFGDVPSHMEVGQQVRISWSTPRDYVRTTKLHRYRPSEEYTVFLQGSVANPPQKIEALDIWKLEDHTRKHEHNIPHLWAAAKGNTTTIWTVPNVRRGSGYEILRSNPTVVLSANDPSQTLPDSFPGPGAVAR